MRILTISRHQGEGRLVSLLEPELTYQVEVRRKLVDATQCETRVPATSKANFTVEDDVNFVPVNGETRCPSLLCADLYLLLCRPGQGASQL